MIFADKDHINSAKAELRVCFMVPCSQVQKFAKVVRKIQELNEEDIKKKKQKNKIFDDNVLFRLAAARFKILFCVKEISKIIHTDHFPQIFVTVVTVDDFGDL